MKKNILVEVNRVREIMGLDLLNEQIDVDDEIIVEPVTDSPYIKWQPTDGPAFYTLKEFKDKHITMRVGGYRYIGPFEPEGYTTLFTDMEKIEDEDFKLSVPVTPTVGGNMDIPFIEIDDRKSKPVGQESLYGGGAMFIGPQADQWNFQLSSLGGSQNIYDNIGEEFGKAGILQTKGQYRFLMYGKHTGNKLGLSVSSIRLRKIDVLKAKGKKEGEYDKKTGYLSKNNYIPQNCTKRCKDDKHYAWHLTGPVHIMPTAGIIGMGGDTPDPIIVTENFKFTVENPFEFDKAGITPEAKLAIEDEMLLFKELKKGEGNKLQQYIDKYLKGKEVMVYAYSSIDADPDEIGGGEYVGPSNCAKRVNGQPTGLRKDYNLCLSQARAEAVAEFLKTEYPEIFGKVIFKPIGKGESNKSGNGVFAKFGTAKQKAHQAKNREATASDRRFEVDLPGATFKNNVIQ